jgi:peptidoglycan/xylan/chitin deacetylase (PgdA/CDA1 family)
MAHLLGGETPDRSPQPAEGPQSRLPRTVGRLRSSAQPGRSVRLWRACHAVILVMALTACSREAPASSSTPTAAATNSAGPVVSLTFHDGTVNQYTFARPILRAHNMHATFYVTSDWINKGYACCVSWQQARELHNAGNEIGAMGVQHLDLTQVYSRNWTEDYNLKKREVCDSRQRLMQKGLDPQSFAYPAGSHRYRFPDGITVEGIVKACGYRSGRAIGGLSPKGPAQAETLPPEKPYALRTPDNLSSSALKLTDLQAMVTGAAGQGRGWIPFVFNEVCHRGDAGYTRCMSASRTVEDTTLSAFLDWLQRAGQAGGAPAGTVTRTVRQVMGAPPQRPVPPPATVVSLTFDDADLTQYAVRGPLRDHGFHATFFANSGTIDRKKPGIMTWAQLKDLAEDGNEIGGHTVTHANLQGSKLTTAQKRREVCDDRQRLIQQRFDPVSFAYPYGVFDRAAESIVKSCGYRSARSAGSVSPTGPAYAETIPPGDPYATWALDSEQNSSGPIQHQYLTSAVTAAAAHGGGWLQLVFHRVCSQSDPTYTACMSSSYAPIDITTFGSFLDWLRRGAPPGVTVKTVRQVMSEE